MLGAAVDNQKNIRISTRVNASSQRGEASVCTRVQTPLVKEFVKPTPLFAPLEPTDLTFSDMVNGFPAPLSKSVSKGELAPPTVVATCALGPVLPHGLPCIAYLPFFEGCGVGRPRRVAYATFKCHGHCARATRRCAMQLPLGQHGYATHETSSSSPPSSS